MDMSATVPAGATFTTVDSVSLLFAALLSPADVVTVVVFVTVPATVGDTTMVTVSLAADAMVPRLHVTITPDRVQLSAAWEGVADTNVTPAGSVSVTVTPVAGFGPALLTWRV